MGTVTKVYNPFDFVTPECTPETRGRRVVLCRGLWNFCIYYIFYVHILFIINTLTSLFERCKSTKVRPLRVSGGVKRSATYVGVVELPG